MNSKFLKASVVASLVLASMPVGGDAAAGSDRNGRLQGTWRVQLDPRNCVTGAPLPSFPVLLSFARGGTLTEVMNSSSFQPGQRTAGLGVWSHSHRNTYKAVWDAFILFDSPVFKRGVQRLMYELEVDGDLMAIVASSQFYDINGAPLAATCATGTGTRFEQAKDHDD